MTKFGGANLTFYKINKLMDKAMKIISKITKLLQALRLCYTLYFIHCH